MLRRLDTAVQVSRVDCILIIDVIVFLSCCSNSEMQHLLKQVQKNLEEASSTGEHMDSKSNACHQANVATMFSNLCHLTPADDKSAEDLELQEDMHAFFQKHCKNATALKERGANSNVPEDSSAQQSSFKQGIQQAGVTKQQKKKRRQQKKAAQPESPSPSPERPPSTNIGSVSDRALQSSGAQDQSTQQVAAQPTAVTDSDAATEVSPPALDERPVEQQQAEAAKDLGNTQYKAAQYEAALQSYSKAIELCPETAAYYGNRAAAALMKRQYKLAVQDCLQATKLNGAFARGYQRAGELMCNHLCYVSEM